jgi:hypothetical protein
MRCLTLMTMTNSPSDGVSRHVVLREGLTLPLDALQLAGSLESRGFTLSRSGDQLVIAPASRLTADDIARLRRWKQHLLAVLDSCDGDGRYA